jgi:hypothetical protein
VSQSDEAHAGDFARYMIESTVRLAKNVVMRIGLAIARFIMSLLVNLVIAP